MLLVFIIYLLASTPIAAAPQAIRPIYRKIGDWLLACDNGRGCMARQVPEPGREPAPGEDGDAGMDIVRKAGAAGVITVRLRADRKLDPAVLHPAGAPPLAGLPWLRDSDGQDAALSGEPARHFVRAIVDAPRLMLDRSGPAHLSLKGLAAILLAMDEAQGRVGNASALVRPGPAPARATPAPAPLPIVRAAPPPPPLTGDKTLAAAIRRLHAKVFAAHECDLPPGGEDAAYPLTASDAIVVIGCGRFAYQTSVLAFRTPRDRPAEARLLALPAPPLAPLPDPDSAGEYVEGSYDPATRTFSEFAKGRGMADCGSATEWTFDGDAFRLSAFRWQDRCGGGLAGDWPILYRTRR